MSIITITTQTDSGPVTTTTISSVQFQSLDAFRLTLVDQIQSTALDGLGRPYFVYTPTVRYATSELMLLGELFKHTVNPALATITPSTASGAAVSAAMAKNTYVAALQSAGSTAATTLRNLWPPSTQNVAYGGFNNTNARTDDNSGAYYTAPDGTQTAIRACETNTGSGNVEHYHYISTDLGAGQHTLSFHLQASQNSFAFIRSTVDGTVCRVWFNLGAGTVGTNNFPGGSTAGMVAMINGWYRCWVTFTASASAQINGLGQATADATYSYTAVDGNGVNQWGAQAENGTLTDYQQILTTQ